MIDSPRGAMCLRCLSRHMAAACMLLRGSDSQVDMSETRLEGERLACAWCVAGIV